MSLLKMCNIRTTKNIIIAVQFVLGQKGVKAWCCKYSPPSEDACGRCLIIKL